MDAAASSDWRRRNQIFANHAVPWALWTALEPAAAISDCLEHLARRQEKDLTGLEPKLLERLPEDLGQCLGQCLGRLAFDVFSRDPQLKREVAFNTAIGLRHILPSGGLRIDRDAQRVGSTARAHSCRRRL